MQKLVVLSGAGVSAESGINTFRDADGLWEGYDVMEVASPQGWEKNPALVLDFYNQRRRQLKSVLPNKAHRLIAELEHHFEVNVITQNVDNLHERAGSTNILHLHGELKKVRSVRNESLILPWEGDIVLGDLASDNQQLRPHIVWFGEAVPAMEKAMHLVANCDICIIVGTSMQVYPAAGLVDFVGASKPIYYIDPNPAYIQNSQVQVIKHKATKGMEILFNKLIDTL